MPTVKYGGEEGKELIVCSSGRGNAPSGLEGNERGREMSRAIGKGKIKGNIKVVACLGRVKRGKN